MENSILKERILMDVENLISRSCTNPTNNLKFENLHVALIKKCYNATDVFIDYHRHRITMNIVMDNKQYDPTTVNINLPVIPTNLLFISLKDFLKSCIEKDSKNLGFYASLLQSFSSKKTKMSLV